MLSRSTEPKCDVLFRREIEERNRLAIDAGQLLQFHVVNAPFTQFALGYEGSALAHLGADFPLRHAGLFSRLYKTAAKCLVGFLIFPISGIHPCRYIQLLTDSPKWGIIGADQIPQLGMAIDYKCETAVDSFATIRLPIVRTPKERAATPVSLVSARTSDEGLISDICKGNKDSLACLFRRYARLVRGVANRVLRDASEADDLLQDVFLLVHRLCGTFDSSKGSARCWILQMAYRRAISRRRYLTSRHFYTHLDLDQAANQLGDTNAASDRPEASMAQAIDRKEALQNWFAELSESQRQTLQLFFFEGYTFEEIATKLGQTVGNARNHYYRGLEKLRKQISAGKLLGKEAVW